MVAAVLVGAVLGLLAGLAIGVVLKGRGAADAAAASTVATARAADAEARLTATAAELETLRSQVAAASERAARSEAAVEAATSRYDELQASIAEHDSVLRGTFAELSQVALQQNSEQFLQLAQMKLAESQVAATTDLEQRQTAIKDLLEPLGKTLAEYQERLQATEVQREGAYRQLLERVGGLKESQEKLQRETQNLVTALRAPQTRGRWGELQLRRVVELAGMVDRCDFTEQVSTDGPDGKLRPDMVISIPGGGTIVVDSKVPLQAFLDASQATTEEERRVHLERHARHVREHINQLSKKEYWNQFDHSPEFVVAFIPGEPLLNAAFEFDDTLMEFALKNNVIPATPTNLITLLRTVAYNWRHEDLEENARKISKLGADLYDRIKTVGTHLSKVQRSLTSTVDSFNSLVGSVETRLLVTARELSREQLAGPAVSELVEVQPVTQLVRGLSSAELAPAEPVEPAALEPAAPPTRQDG